MIGTALTAPIETDFTDIKLNRLLNWELCSRLKREFWSKWTNDYITSLQKRSKWLEKERNFKVGDMVLLKEENTPPLSWPLGRIERVYKGTDDGVRVAEVYTKGKVCKRPIVKLALLPIEDNTNNANNELMSKWYSEKVSNKKCNNDVSIKCSNEDEMKQLTASASKNQQTNEIKKEKTVPTRKSKRAKKEKESEETMAMYAVCEKSNTWWKKGCEMGMFWSTVIFFTIIVGMLFSNVNGMEANDKYKLMQFENATAYFQNHGSGAIIDGKWNLFTYMNLHEFDEDVKRLEQNMYELENHCEKNSTNMCRKTVVEMQSMMERVNGFHQTIKTNLEFRGKRALGAVGIFAYSFFGSVIGYIPSKIVDTVNKNGENKALEEMLHQQTSVLEIVNEEIVYIKNVSEKENQREEIIDWTIAYVATSINRLHETQKLVMNMLSTEKTLSPVWLRPDELATQIQMISDNLPANTRLIGNTMKEKIWNVYQFAKLKTIVTKQALVIVIEIPLVSITKYDYFELMPLPFMHNEEMMTIANVHKHIWVNENELYYPSSDVI